MVGWHHQLNAHKFEQAPRVSDGQGSLARGPDPSSKATLWVKAQHEGALPPPCIVRKDPRHSRILYDPPPRILEIKAKINQWDLIMIPSAQRFVWAARQPLGNAALGALFA